MPAPLALWLVEDEPRFSEPFADLISTTEEFVLERTFCSYEEAVCVLDQGRGWTPPDVVLMDYRLPGADGLTATRDLKGRLPSVPVVVLTGNDKPHIIFQALRAGASGYIAKGTESERVLAAIREAYHGGLAFPPSVARHVLAFFGADGEVPPALSEREREIVELLARGLSKGRIAAALFLSPHTVNSHLRNVYEKLHVHSAAEVVATALRLRII